MFDISMKRACIFLTGVQIMVSSFSFSQNNNSGFYFSINAHDGMILAQHNYIRDMVGGNSTAIEVNFSRPVCGKKIWHCIYHCPEVGVTFVGVQFANPAVLGNGFSFYPFINFNIAQGKIIALKFKVGTSLGYVTKKYGEDNPTNIMIGSNMNGFVNLRLNAQIRLSEKWRIETGIGMTHFSNGAMKLPNLGINMVSFNLGLGYHFGENNKMQMPDTVICRVRTFHVVTYASVGWAALTRGDSKKYTAGVVSINYETFNGKKIKWNAGAEVLYDGSLYERYKSDTIIGLANPVQNVQVGVKAGFALVVGRLSMPVEMGYYAYSRVPYHFFHRIGLRYQINDHFVASLTLRTRWAHADFFEFGFGYSIPVTRKKCKE
ncbi:MAG: acyloxyacyl hydrolase [Bacteroidetes bacterium]|nr:acyloxyacyl hydrolase [Bacteroidota bacterium]